ncbi:MAG TPA: AarF/UbiB family protein [Pyrinomonadaceae bacterium]|nr:AarF/UbiB family protein [Pyrinomonadaceae bacterium]
MTETLKDGRRSLDERVAQRPAAFRRRLERLGPTFIKIGQFLALRPDIVPQEYCDELISLLDRVPPFPWPEARLILKEEFGREPDKVFTYINPRPVAAGSLAQTHVARLHDGTEVAVKIQRPHIRARVARDLRKARLLARVFEMTGGSFIASPTEVVEELSGWLMQELDLSHELRNLSRLYDFAAGSQIQKVPQPFADYSTPRVLTTEYLRGVPVSDLLRAARAEAHPAEDEEWFSLLGVDRDRLAKNLMTASLTQIFRYQFFHADLHPGNLFVLPDDVVGFVDFGLCDELDESVRERQMRFLSAIYGDDANRMFSAVTGILVAGPDTNMEAFRAEFMAETSACLGRKRPEPREHDRPRYETERSPVAQCMVGVMRAARRNKLHVPARVLSMYRALLTAEAVANQLGASADLRSVGREFFEDLRLDEAVSLAEPENLENTLLNTILLLRDSPGQLQQILSELSDGRFELKVNISETPRIRRVRNKRLRLLVTSITTVGISLLLTAPQLPELFGASLRGPLWVVLLLLYAWAYFQWRRLR